MANLAIYSGVAAKPSGETLVRAPAAIIEVRREDTGALASIYSDEAGTTPITNPSAFADANGNFKFYAAGLERGYRVTVTDGAFSLTRNNQAVGTAQQFDTTTFIGTFLAAVSAAAARVVLGLTAIAAKGDTWFGTAANTLATKSAPANGRVRMAASSQSDGWLDVPALAKVINGLTYANNGADATNDLDIATGGAMDATGAYWMTLASALTKQSDVAWAVGSAAGGLDTGAVGNNDYYIWLIARSDTGVVDVLFSLSSTAPTMPTNYDFKRLIGWFKRVGGTVVAFKTYELEGGGLEFRWNAPTEDVNLAATLTTTRRTDAVKVPLNFSVLADLTCIVMDGAANVYSRIMCPDETDAAVTASNGNINNTTAFTQNGLQMLIRTSATGTIAARSNTATIDTYIVLTDGFRWARRN